MLCRFPVVYIFCLGLLLLLGGDITRPVHYLQDIF